MWNWKQLIIHLPKYSENLSMTFLEIKSFRFQLFGAGLEKKSCDSMKNIIHEYGMQVLHTSVEVDIFQRNFRKNSKRNRSTNAPIKLYVKSLYTHVSTKTKKKNSERHLMINWHMHEWHKKTYIIVNDLHTEHVKKFSTLFVIFLYIFLSCSCWDFVSLLWTFFYTLQQSKKSLKVYVSSLAVLWEWIGLESMHASLLRASRKKAIWCNQQRKIRFAWANNWN